MDDLVSERSVHGRADAFAEVLDIEEVAGREAVAVDDERLAPQRQADEVRDHALLVGRDRTVDVREAERDDRKVEGAGERVAVRLAAELARPVRRDRPGKRAFVNGRLRVAHDRAARRCEDELPDPCCGRGAKRDECPPHVDLEVRDRILDGLDDRAESGKMDDRADALHCARHGVLVAHVGLEDLEVHALEVGAATA